MIKRTQRMAASLMFAMPQVGAFSIRQQGAKERP
jgi:hypothetical protein